MLVYWLNQAVLGECYPDFMAFQSIFSFSFQSLSVNAHTVQNDKAHFIEKTIGKNLEFNYIAVLLCVVGKIL